MTAALGALFAGKLSEEDSSEVEFEPDVKMGIVAWKNEFHISGTVVGMQWGLGWN